MEKVKIKLFRDCIGTHRVVGKEGELVTVPVDRAVDIVARKFGEYEGGKEPKAATDYKKANNIK